MPGHRTTRPRSTSSLVLAGGAAVAAAFVTASVAALAAGAPFLLSFVVVAIASWHFGSWSGAASAVAGLPALLLLVVPPLGELTPASAADAVRIGTYVIAAGVVVLFARAKEQSEAQARQSHALFQLVVDHGPVLVAGADGEGRTVVFNRACEQLTGFSRDEVIGGPFLQTFVPESWRERVAARFRDEPLEVLARPHHNPWQTKGSGERLIEWRCFRVVRPDQGPLTLGIGQDVTDREEAQQQLQASLERETAALRSSEEANRQKERFIAQLAHELRTPLNAARGWVHMLRRAETPGFSDPLASVDRSLEMMQALIEDVVDLTRAEFGKLTLNKTAVAPGPLVYDLLASVRSLTDDRRLKLNAEVAGDLPRIHVDQKRFAQVLLNLLGNAIKFSPEAGTVSVDVASQDGAVLFSVSDEGPGIPLENRERVFQAFWQAEGGARGDGLGLGLALVRRLVEAHGGDVRIQDGRRGGTTITVTLPIGGAASDSQVAV